MIIVTPDVQNAIGRGMYIDSATTANWEGFIARSTIRSARSSGERWSQEAAMPMSWHSAPTTRESSGAPGVDGHTQIELYEVSKQMDVVAVNSLPLDPTGTNTVTIVR